MTKLAFELISSIIYESTESTETTETEYKFSVISNRIKLLERHRIHNLRILPTPNNPVSSRSFLQITITLKANKQNGKKGKLVIFDMPGTENSIRTKLEFIGEGIFNDIQDRDRINFKNKANLLPEHNKHDIDVYWINEDNEEGGKNIYAIFITDTNVENAIRTNNEAMKLSFKRGGMLSWIDNTAEKLNIGS